MNSNNPRSAFLHDIEVIRSKGDDVIAISRVAYGLYLELGTSKSQDEREALMDLMVMEEGPEFCLEDDEIDERIAVIRNSLPDK